MIYSANPMWDYPTPPANAPVLAEMCGYVSELEFLEESEKLVTTSPHAWFATADRIHGGWVVWCDSSTSPDPTLKS